MLEHFYSVFSDLCLHFQNIFPLFPCVCVCVWDWHVCPYFMWVFYTSRAVIFVYFIVLWARCACANCSSAKKNYYILENRLFGYLRHFYSEHHQNDREQTTHSHMQTHTYAHSNPNWIIKVKILCALKTDEQINGRIEVDEKEKNICAFWQIWKWRPIYRRTQAISSILYLYSFHTS